jgi:hypothetical protein
MMGASWQRRSSQRGFVLIFAMTALFVVLVLSTISLQIAMQSVSRSASKRDATVARDLAEGACDAAEAWLRMQTTPPSGTAVLGPDLTGAHGTLTSGTYSASIVPDLGNPSAYRKSYTLIGVGEDRFTHATRTVQVQVKEQSFALYAYFTDHEVSSITNGTIWFIAADRLYGPVHTNDKFHITWSTSATTPIFAGTVSQTATSAEWSPSKPNTTANWKKVFSGGQDAFTTGADSIPLPTVSEEQRIAAWGTATSPPTSPPAAARYVTVNGAEDSGIYIVGDADSVTFSANGSVGQQVEIIQHVTSPSTLYTKTVVLTNLSAETTTVKKYTATSSGGTYTLQTTTSSSCLPDGVIYCTGNINSLSGTLVDNLQNGTAITQRNAWTVATDISAGKDITITNDLQYATHPAMLESLTSLTNLKAACLGLVGDDIIVKNNTKTNLRIDGTVLAASSFYNQYWNSGSTQGALTISGGVIQHKRGPVGQFSGSTITSGYSKSYYYDPRMADSPPPHFPTTGQFDVISWQSN